MRHLPPALMLTTILIIAFSLVSIPIAHAPEPVGVISVTPSTIAATVCSQFGVQVLTHAYDDYSSPPEPAINQIYFYLEWDSSQMEIKLDHVVDNAPSGWASSAIPPTSQQPPYYQLVYSAIKTTGNDVTTAYVWLEVEFHCIGEGTSTIQILGLTINGQSTLPDWGLVPAQVNQYTPPPPRSNPVGGVILPVNELAILVPYLALIGLITSLFTIYALKRKRKN